MNTVWEMISVIRKYFYLRKDCHPRPTSFDEAVFDACAKRECINDLAAAAPCGGMPRIVAKSLPWLLVIARRPARFESAVGGWLTRLSLSYLVKS